jgi:protein tyrosine phosphatase (PTP) superfamily phosphohydrolase (DUF442 family)
MDGNAHAISDEPNTPGYAFMLRSLWSSVPTSSPPLIPPAKKLPRIRAFVKILVLSLVVLLLAEVLNIYVGSNFRTVIADQCYRSGQPNECFLQEVQRTHGIRSILNLRDENLNQSWYVEEKNAADRLGIKLINAGLSSSEQPPDHEFRRFVEGMEACEPPVLIHCANGNDRSGLAAAIYLMLFTKTPLPEARCQLSLRYGHIAWGKAGCLQRILDSYETWLNENGYQHTADHFRHWAKTEYHQE